MPGSAHAVADEALAGLTPALVTLFFGTIAVGMVLESLVPGTPLRYPLRRRWLANATLFTINQILFRTLLPLTTLGAALVAAERGWGLLNSLALPAPLMFVASLLLLDGAHYAVHRLQHSVPALWRFHRLHHSDPDVDVSTAIRFHPMEALLQSAAVAGAALALGAHPLAAAAHMSLLAVAMPFSHLNITIPQWLDTPMRWIVVTPGMHQLHHSTVRADHDSNYALGLSLWDRLFGTYRAEPVAGFAGLRFGVGDRTPEESISLPRMLADPLRP